MSVSPRFDYYFRENRRHILCHQASSSHPHTYRCLAQGDVPVCLENTWIKERMNDWWLCEMAWHYSGWIRPPVSSAPIPVLRNANPSPKNRKVSKKSGLHWTVGESVCSRCRGERNNRIKCYQVKKFLPHSFIQSTWGDGESREEKIKFKAKQKRGLQMRELEERKANRRKMAEWKADFFTYYLMKISLSMST